MDSDNKKLAKLVNRLCKIMRWKQSKSHKFEIIRRTCSGQAVALGLDKGNELADRLEMLQKRVNYLETMIEETSWRTGNTQINAGEWMSFREWAEKVMRGY